MASVIITSTNWPISRGSPAKLTKRMFSVRPLSSFGSRVLGFSTSTRCTLPTIAELIARALALIAACNRCSRSCLTASGVGSARFAAGVPGRAEKMKEKLWSKPTESTSARVLSKSSSVSVGKPTMKSVDTQMSGRTARNLRILRLYSSAV